jgi:hypothetical protein
MNSQLPAEAATSGFFTDALKTVDQSLRRNSKPALATPSEARQYISNVVERLDYGQPFVKRLGEVNKNLASHGNTSLSPTHAQVYGDLAAVVSEGQISNAGAHAFAAAKWYEHFATTRRPSGVAGTLMNFGGALVSGVTDQKLHKTGEVLRKAR